MSGVIPKLEIERLLRYAYGGILLAFLGVLVEPEITKRIIQDLGVVLAPLSILAIGGVIYIAHRHVLGELLFFQVHRVFHFFRDLLSGRRQKGKENYTSSTSYLGSLGVGWFQRRTAYAAWRRFVIDDPKLKANLDLAHSETNLLWMTVEQVLVVAIYLEVKSSRLNEDAGSAVESAKTAIMEAATKAGSGAYTAWWIMVFLFLIAIAADIQAHTRDTLDMRRDEPRLKKYLQDMGYIPKETSEAQKKEA